MKISKPLWYGSLIVLAVVAIGAWTMSWHFAQIQEAMLWELGEDITQHPQKWAGATLAELGPFAWWRDLDLGHGLAREFGMVADLALMAIIGLLGGTLFWQSRKRTPPR